MLHFPRSKQSAVIQRQGFFYTAILLIVLNIGREITVLYSAPSAKNGDRRRRGEQERTMTGRKETGEKRPGVADRKREGEKLDSRIGGQS